MMEYTVKPGSFVST